MFKIPYGVYYYLPKIWREQNINNNVHPYIPYLIKVTPVDGYDCHLSQVKSLFILDCHESRYNRCPNCVLCSTFLQRSLTDNLKPGSSRCEVVCVDLHFHPNYGKYQDRAIALVLKVLVDFLMGSDPGITQYPPGSCEHFTSPIINPYSVNTPEY